MFFLRELDLSILSSVQYKLFHRHHHNNNININLSLNFSFVRFVNYILSEPLSIHELLKRFSILFSCNYQKAIFFGTLTLFWSSLRDIPLINNEQTESSLLELNSTTAQTSPHIHLKSSRDSQYPIASSTKSIECFPWRDQFCWKYYRLGLMSSIWLLLIQLSAIQGFEQSTFPLEVGAKEVKVGHPFYQIQFCGKNYNFNYGGRKFETRCVDHRRQSKSPFPN